MLTFSGVITALVTPLRNDALDEEALRRLIDEQIAGGVDGLVPVGTTGESPTLTVEEHIRVIEITVQAAKRRVPVIAGTGSNSTRETIDLSQAARKVGADGLLLVTPYYNRPGQDHLYRHFKTVIQAVPLPTVVYNVPSRTACDLLPETLARLCEIPEVVGVKEATGSVLRAAQILARTGDRFGRAFGGRRDGVPAVRPRRQGRHLGRQQRRARGTSRRCGTRPPRAIGRRRASCTTSCCRCPKASSSRRIPCP